MSRFVGSWKDYWRHERWLLNPAGRANHSHLNSLQGAPKPLIGDVPHPDLVIDPVVSQAHSLDRYYSWQASCGFDLDNKGLQPQTASDLQNLTAAKEYKAASVSAPAYQAPPPHAVVFNRPLHREPWHDPMSTIPGGPGSMGPVR